jgi:hypothetical protein
MQIELERPRARPAPAIVAPRLTERELDDAIETNRVGYDVEEWFAPNVGSEADAPPRPRWLGTSGYGAGACVLVAVITGALAWWFR